MQVINQNMHGYLIIPMNAQVMDVIHQVRATMDIGQVHHIKIIQLPLGASIGTATCAPTM